MLCATTVVEWGVSLYVLKKLWTASFRLIFAVAAALIALPNFFMKLCNSVMVPHESRTVLSTAQESF